MTGGGAPGAAGILHCLRQQPNFVITVADANEFAVGRYLHDDFITIPPAADPHFTDRLLTICKERKVDIILPLVTKELLLLAGQKEHFASAGIKILVSPAEGLTVANNKAKLYGFLQWKGIAVPAFKVVQSVEEFEAAVHELGYPAQPVCFKPAVSNGSRGFRILDPGINESDLLFLHKPNSTYITYTDAIRILSQQAFPELLVSEYLPGEEYSVDCLARNGETIVVVPRLRKKMINGISVEGEFVQNETIISYCRRIIGELQLHGNIGIQVKASAQQEMLLLEINPRVQGTIVAGLGAGINLPALAVLQEMNIPVSREAMQVKWGTRFSRYWSEVFY